MVRPGSGRIGATGRAFVLDYSDKIWKCDTLSKREHETLLRFWAAREDPVKEAQIRKKQALAQTVVVSKARKSKVSLAPISFLK